MGPVLLSVFSINSFKFFDFSFFFYLNIKPNTLNFYKMLCGCHFVEQFGLAFKIVLCRSVSNITSGRIKMALYCTAVKIILKKSILDRSWLNAAEQMNRQSQLLKLSVISHDTMNTYNDTYNEQSDMYSLNNVLQGFESDNICSVIHTLLMDLRKT